MPTSDEMKQRKRDEMRVKIEDAKTATARKVVLRKRLTELTHQRSDIDRQVREINNELSKIR